MTDTERKEYVNYISTSRGCFKSWLPADKPFIGDTPKGSYVVQEWKDGFFEKAHNYVNECPSEDFGITSDEGLTVLHYFSIYNLYEEVEILLKRGADPNIAGVATSDEDKHTGVTPFHFACYHGNLEMAKLLISYGADTSLCDARGNNAYNHPSNGWFAQRLKAFSYRPAPQDAGFHFSFKPIAFASFAAP